MRVLVTRPAEDQARTVAALAARGHFALSVPVMRIVACAVTVAPPVEAVAVVATSAHAFRHAATGLVSSLRHLPAFVVGDQTATAAREAGFGEVTSASGDAGALAALLVLNAPPEGGIIYLAGSPRRDTLERESGLKSRLAVVETYRAEAEDGFAEALQVMAAGGWPDVVLHFSAHQAALLARHLIDSRLAPLLTARHLAISPQAGAPLAGLVPCRYAVRPTLASLVELLD